MNEMDMFSSKGNAHNDKNTPGFQYRQSSAENLDAFGGVINSKSEATDNSNQKQASELASDLELLQSFGNTTKTEQNDKIIHFRDENEYSDLDDMQQFKTIEPANGNHYVPIEEFEFTKNNDSTDNSAAMEDDGGEGDSAGEDSAAMEDDSGEGSRSLNIILKATSLISVAADFAKYKLLCKKFERGRVVLAMTESNKTHNPLMYLLQLGHELMAYRYLGSSLDVVIPAYVCDLPVRYLHPDFLRGSLNPFNGIKFQNLKSNLGVNQIANFNMDSVKTSLKGARSLVLPNTLTEIPPEMFGYCVSLKELVIPESVTAVSSRAFAYSSFEDIYFNGECPSGFLDNVELPDGVRIHVRQQFADTFGLEVSENEGGIRK